MSKKWYSSGVTEDVAKHYEKRHAKIEEPEFGIDDRGSLALSFGLSYENGSCTCIMFYDIKDIKNLLIETEAMNVSNLEGKIVEAYVKFKNLRCISVNKNLV